MGERAFRKALGAGAADALLVRDSLRLLVFSALAIRDSL